MAELTIEAVEKVLDERVRPALESHGGGVLVDSLEGDTLFVKLLGACHGCPSASATMGFLVESEVKQALPEIKEVALVEGVSEELLAQARQMLEHRWEA